MTTGAQTISEIRSALPRVASARPDENPRDRTRHPHTQTSAVSSARLSSLFSDPSKLVTAKARQSLAMKCGGAAPVIAPSDHHSGQEVYGNQLAHVVVSNPAVTRWPAADVL